MAYRKFRMVAAVFSGHVCKPLGDCWETESIECCDMEAGARDGVTVCCSITISLHWC